MQSTAWAFRYRSPSVARNSRAGTFSRYSVGAPCDTNRVGSTSADIALPQSLILLIKRPSVSSTMGPLKWSLSLSTCSGTVKFRINPKEGPLHKTNLFHEPDQIVEKLLLNDLTFIIP